MPPSVNPTVRPSKSRVTQSPTAYHADPDLDLSNKAVDTGYADEPGEDEDDAQVFVLAERSSWNTSFSSTNGTMFTPLFIGVIAGGAVLVVLFAAVMFSVVGQRLRRKRYNLDEMADEESTITGTFPPSAIYGLGEGNDNGTMGPYGNGSTIKTMGSLQTRRSMKQWFGLGLHSVAASFAGMVKMIAEVSL